MKKQKIGLFVLAALVMTAGHASYQQNMQLCLNVTGTGGHTAFYARFVSSDLFDTGNYTGIVANGQSCVKHTYSQGPKNIKLELKVNGNRTDINDTLIIPDGSCNYFHNVAGGWLASDYERANTAHQFWSLNITEAPPVNGYKYAYYLKCDHLAN